jgi:hypothetical protein
MDLLHRIRWGNVARAAALVAAVALVVAWPRLRSDPPPLPPQPRVEDARAAAPSGDEFGLDRPVEERVPPEEPRAGRESDAPPAKRRRAAPKRRRKRPSESPIAPPPAPPANPAPPARRWTPPPPAGEFGFE